MNSGSCFIKNPSLEIAPVYWALTILVTLAFKSLL